jgi:hypothetical protein
LCYIHILLNSFVVNYFSMLREIDLILSKLDIFCVQGL